MQAAALKEVVRPAVHTVKSLTQIAAEAADGVSANALVRKSARRNGGAVAAAAQHREPSAEPGSPLQVSPSRWITTDPVDEVVVRNIPVPAFVPPPGLAPPPGLEHLLPSGEVPSSTQAYPAGKSPKSLAAMASCMSKKDRRALSSAAAAAAVHAAPGTASCISKKDARLLSSAAAAAAAAAPAASPKSQGISIEELIQKSSEKYDINEEFWGKYSNLTAMALASEKQEILEIVNNFALIRRKHVYLFQRLKTTVLRTMDKWAAADLAILCHAWAQLGFLHEDLCVAMADRVVATIGQCGAKELCWLLDAYATARVTVASVTEAVTLETWKHMDDFSPEQLCLHSSSFARLNIANASLFRKIGDRLVTIIQEELQAEESERKMSARDLTLAAYSFAKLGLVERDIFEVVAAGALPVARNFTARDLQMMLVAFARAQHFNHDLLQAMSAQAQRRIAQFNAESLALTLRSLAFFRIRDDALLTRVVGQLPRMSLTFRPIDAVTILNAFASLQVNSTAFFDVITPTILERASLFTPSDWVGALQGYSALGRRDEDFLKALCVNLPTSRLTIRQLAATMAGCASLSFTQATESLAETAPSFDQASVPVNAAAQMYSALVLLGYTSGGPSPSSKVQAVMSGLCNRLATQGTAAELSVRSCLDLCYASLLAPPPKEDGVHPVKLCDLLDRLERSEDSLFSQEEKLLLGQMCRALELLPWNRNALRAAVRLEELAEEVDPDSGRPNLPLAYFSSILGVLAPHPPIWSAMWTNDGNGTGDEKRMSGNDERLLASVASLQPQAHGFTRGAYAAAEVRDGLEDVSSTLRMHDVKHNVVLDDLSVGAFIHSNFGVDKGATRFSLGFFGTLR